MSKAENLVLIVIVAQFRDEKKTVKAALDAGASGITYFYGRGTGVRQRLGFLGNLIQKEKVVLLTAVPADKADGIMASVNKAVSLNKPGKGFACVLKMEQVFGYL